MTLSNATTKSVLKTSEPLLEIVNLSVTFGSGPGIVEAVRRVDLNVNAGQVMGLVGESGSGKTVTARAVMGLLPPSAAITSGSIQVAGDDVLAMTERELRELRGKRVAMIFQDPLSALNPAMRVGDQVVESLRVHGMGRDGSTNRARELLDLVGIPSARERMRDYPHQFSGGMRQRVVIAMAVANNPDLIIADEPTTALDVTVQAQILRLLAQLRSDLGIATLLITHDLGVVAELCDDVAVMYRGEIVERASSNTIFHGPEDPYTQRLLNAVPRIDGIPRHRGDAARRGDPALVAEQISVDVSSGKPMPWRAAKPIYAVDRVSLTLRYGEIHGLVGESGCGKSTLSRALCGLAAVSAGEVRLGSSNVTDLPAGHIDRRGVQYVFQDPFGSLNPLRTVGQSVSEAIASPGLADRPTVNELLEMVDLDVALSARYPSALSGGQRQRVGIARALAANSKVLLCDEPVSALDVSIQAQIIELLAKLRDDLDIAALFVAHDLAVVRDLSDHVSVMFLGRIVETGEANEVYESPQHPYTVSLLSSTPIPDPDVTRNRIVLQGDLPSLTSIPKGCRFAGRCPIGPKFHADRAVCHEVDPDLKGPQTHAVACHFPGELTLDADS